MYVAIVPRYIAFLSDGQNRYVLDFWAHKRTHMYNIIDRVCYVCLSFAEIHQSMGFWLFVPLLNSHYFR